MLTFGSLFAGIGGFDLGLEWAGMKCEWQVEYDSYCNKILEKHWPDVPRYGDIKEIDPSNLTPVDVICGGFPCQPVSIIGKGLAQDDERWLWPEFCRIVRGVRPKYVLVENVSGLLGRGLGDVLGDLASIGYDAEWQSIPASAVGAPHLRYRVWIFAWDRGRGREGDVADADGRPKAERGERPAAAGPGHEWRDDRGRSDRDSGEIALRSAGQDSGAVADPDRASAWARSGEGEASGGVAQPDRSGRPRDGGASGRDRRTGVAADASSERLGMRTPEHGKEAGVDVPHGHYLVGLDRHRGEEAGRLAHRAVRAARDSGRGGIFGDRDAALRSLRLLLGIFGRGWWATEPGMGRVVDGLPNRVDRIKALGNAVVPQNAYLLGTLVSAFDEIMR